MKILSSYQIKKLEQDCIDHEHISSIDLIEKAATSCFNWIIHHKYLLTKTLKNIILLVGTGKNGGDGITLAKKLYLYGYNITTIYIVNIANHESNEFVIQKNNIIKYGINIEYIYENQTFPLFNNPYNTLLIDAIFGIGFNRPITSIYWISFFNYINNQNFSNVISIDIPSGLLMEEEKSNMAIIKATYTLSFHFPKISFFLPDYADYIGKWYLLNIGWKENYVNNIITKYFFIDKYMISKIYIKKKRHKFTHKGTYGHGLLIGGSYGMIGSIALASKASLKTGIGKLSVYIPRCGYTILQQFIPEAIVQTDNHDFFIQKIPLSFKVNSIGIGMGMGDKNEKTSNAVKTFLLYQKKYENIPIVIDADAINILSKTLNFVNYLPYNTILTPHPKEFYKLCGSWKNDYHKLEKLKTFSQKNNIFCVLKGAYSIISTPDGYLYFNSTGNPGMATAGSGDVLSGIITSLLSQGYSQKEACIFGVYIHGLSGDIAAEQKSEESIIAEDIINYMDQSYQKINNY
ncbi:NAD(P)H-hydrate dehydratase [Blattabacterium cuenoti]|uniref:NAD(P)H-hydrate dehydratase n=1 Tax=Blattabacterium cuenoti TaxID=1653831 RepID=UPI00163BFD1D|nr:NAD(P)H-hydrate dehydratase [Blattabacterium cuenoti]